MSAVLVAAGRVGLVLAVLLVTAAACRIADSLASISATLAAREQRDRALFAGVESEPSR